MTRPRDSTLARSLVRSVGRAGRVGHAARAFRGAKDPRSAPRRSPRDPFAAAGRGDFCVCATAVRASPCITPRAPHPRHAAPHMRLLRASLPHSCLGPPHARARVAAAAAAAATAVVIVIIVVVDRSIARSIARTIDRSIAWSAPPTHPCAPALALAVAEVRAQWFVGGGFGDVGSLPVSR